MPYRCVNCRALSRNEEIECKCPVETRKTQRIEVVHFCSEQGTGPLTVKVDDKSLRVHCSTTKSPSKTTPFLALTTCLDCIDKLNELAKTLSSETSEQGTNQ